MGVVQSGKQLAGQREVALQIKAIEEGLLPKR